MCSVLDGSFPQVTSASQSIHKIDESSQKYKLNLAEKAKKM